MPEIVIIDYGMGNLRSVYNKVKRMGVDCVISNDPAVVQTANGIVLPGVGHYGKAMDNLKQLGILSVLENAVLEKYTPILGICLGMQLLFERSEEGNELGLGWLKGEVVRFSLQSKLKIPHIGWNSTEQVKQHPILSNIPNGSLVYFVHSYHAVPQNPGDILETTHYGYSFASSVQNGNIIGMQYHPEKSQDIGGQIFKNFVQMVQQHV